MYKLLLVEDELLIRKGLSAKIQHLDLGISEIFEAGDSLEALEMVEQDIPDILVTDIRLLHMDGLSMAEQIQKKCPDVKIIVVSGYSEFEYAQKAITLSVASYLVKPVGLEELRGALQKCIGQIKSQRFAYRDKELLQKQKEMLECVRQAESLLFGSGPREGGGYLARCFPSAVSYVLAALSVSHESLADSKFLSKDMALIRYALINIVNDTAFPGDRVAFYHLQNHSQVLVLFGMDEQKDYGLVGAYCEKLIRLVARILEITVNVYLSQPHEQISEVLAVELLAAENSKPVGFDGILRYGQVGGFSEDQPDSQALRYLKSCLASRSLGQMEEALEQLFACRESEGCTVAFYRRLLLSVADIVESLKEELRLSTPVETKLREAAGDLGERFSGAQSIHLFVSRCLFSVFEEGCADLDEVGNANRVRMARQYIQQHYDEPVSVHQLAKLFKLNPNYFSTLFKKETGSTVIHYLNDVRIERARSLLRTTEISVAELSRIIGFENVNYFYKQFKKHEGVTPMEYRSRCQTVKKA